MSICKSCEKRKECTFLCPKAYAYANQDYVSQTAVALEDAGGDFESPWLLSANHTEEIAQFDFLTPLENRILSMFYLRRLTYAQIARAISGNRSKEKKNQRAVKHHLSKARLKMVSFFSYSNRQ